MKNFLMGTLHHSAALSPLENEFSYGHCSKWGICPYEKTYVDKKIPPWYH